jgi:hypothetical protein
VDWIKNLSLKKSFFAIITTSLIAAIVLSVLFSSLCNALIDHFDLYVTVPVEESSLDNSEAIDPDNSAIVIMGEGGTQTTYYYTYKVEPGYSIPCMERAESSKSHFHTDFDCRYFIYCYDYGS